MSGMTKKDYIFSLDEFATAYIEAALWSSVDDQDEPLDSNYGIESIALKTLVLMDAECRLFKLQNQKDIGDRLEQAGHDLWLTRNHHGCGYWEKTNWPEEAGQRLTEAAHKFGEVSLYVQRGKIYQE